MLTIIVNYIIKFLMVLIDTILQLITRSALSHEINFQMI